MIVHLVLLGLAIGLSPLPVLAQVLTMVETGRTGAAVGIAIGWFSALALIGLAAVVVGAQVDASSSGTSTATAIVDLALGAALLVLALRRWLRWRTGDRGSLPGWIGRLASMSVPVGIALGAFLPPYVVAVAAGNVIVRSGQGRTAAIVAVAVFAVLGSIGVILVPGLVIAQPARAEVRLASWRGWLEANWQMVVTILFAVVGAYLLVKGIAEL